MVRTASVVRETKETNISIELDLDGDGTQNVDTGIGVAPTPPSKWRQPVADFGPTVEQLLNPELLPQKISNSNFSLFIKTWQSSFGAGKNVPRSLNTMIEIFQRK